MTTLFSIGVTNALIATLLAIAIWCVTRVWRQPPLAQLLWVLVLVKLVTPPLVTIPWQFVRTPTAVDALTNANPIRTEMREPINEVTVEQSTIPKGVGDGILAMSARPTDQTLPPNVSAHSPIGRGGEIADATREPLHWVAMLITVWVTGSVIWLLIALTRLARFHRGLRNTASCSAELDQWADEVAAKLGVRSRFRLRMTDARLSPLVWPIGRPTIVLSRPLLAELSRDEIKTLLAHELAHLRRKDHWLRWLELSVSALYWWHPIVWWTRRMIQARKNKHVTRGLCGRFANRHNNTHRHSSKRCK